MINVIKFLIKHSENYQHFDFIDNGICIKKKCSRCVSKFRAKPKSRIRA
jgi:hypothetical protein